MRRVQEEEPEPDRRGAGLSIVMAIMLAVAIGRSNLPILSWVWLVIAAPLSVLTLFRVLWPGRWWVSTTEIAAAWRARSNGENLLLLVAITLFYSSIIMVGAALVRLAKKYFVFPS
jgi:hypothetical protein